jgi:hypothetical protein
MASPTTAGGRRSTAARRLVYKYLPDRILTRPSR